MKASILITTLLGAGLLASAAMAQSADPSPEKLALAEQMVHANGGAERASTQVKLLYATMTKAMEESGTITDPRFQRLYNAMVEKVQVRVIDLIPTILDVSAKSYANELTEDEMRGWLAWAQSDVGRSMQAKLPTINRETMLALGPVLNQLIHGAQADSIQAACEELKCTANERARLIALVDKAGAHKPS